MDSYGQRLIYWLPCFALQAPLLVQSPLANMSSMRSWRQSSPRFCNRDDLESATPKGKPLPTWVSRLHYCILPFDVFAVHADTHGTS